MTWWMWSLFILSMCGITPLFIIMNTYIIYRFYKYPEYFSLLPRKCCKFCIRNDEDRNTCTILTNTIDFMGDREVRRITKSAENRNNTCEFFYKCYMYTILDSIFVREPIILPSSTGSSIVGRVRFVNQEINIPNQTPNLTSALLETNRLSELAESTAMRRISHVQLTDIAPIVVEPPSPPPPIPKVKKKSMQKPPYTEEIINNIPNYNLRKE